MPTRPQHMLSVPVTRPSTHRSLWIRGLSARRLGEPEEALRLSENAMAAFGRVGERVHVGAVASTAADLARTMANANGAGSCSASCYRHRTGAICRSPIPLLLQCVALRSERRPAGSGTRVSGSRAACGEGLRRNGRAPSRTHATRSGASTAGKSRRRTARVGGGVWRSHYPAQGWVQEYMRGELQMIEAAAVIQRDPAGRSSPTRRCQANLPDAGSRSASGNQPRYGTNICGREPNKAGRTGVCHRLAVLRAGALSICRRSVLRAEFFGSAATLYEEAIRLKLREGDAAGAFALAESVTESDTSRCRRECGRIVRERGSRSTPARAG